MRIGLTSAAANPGRQFWRALQVLRQELNDSLKEAMKAGDKGRLGTIRLIQSALKDKDIEARGNGKEPLGDEEILQLLQKMVKQRQESARLYTEGNRPELAAQENAEIATISAATPSSCTMSAKKTTCRRATKAKTVRTE